MKEFTIVILIVTAVTFIVGTVFKYVYIECYQSSAVNTGAVIFQSICNAALAVTVPNPDITIWFILSVVGVLLSYAVGLTLCYMQAKSDHASKGHTVMAMIAQALLPIGFALVILIVITLLTGNRKKRK